MKKLLCLFVMILFLYSAAYASPHHSQHNNYHNQSSHSSSSSSTPVYLVKKETNIDKVKFKDCEDHYAMQETIIDYYSDGSKRTYTNSTVYKSDGTILVSDCRKIEHLVYEDKHYFIVYKQKGAQLLDNNAESITIRKYSSIQSILPNRLLVKYNKKYGIIDLTEKVIVPIKYQHLEQIGFDKFIAKLNGYYGIIDVNNNIILDCDCDKIKPLFDTYVVKRYDKYGLYDINANKIADINNDKIEKEGEYILVKKNNKYSIYDYAGRLLTDIKYKKVRLKRNHLQGLNNKNKWEKII